MKTKPFLGINVDGNAVLYMVVPEPQGHQVNSQRKCELTKNMITPFDDFVYLLNNVILGDEPSIEDFILLIGTIVAFVAFILWCCFPIAPKESQTPLHYEAKDYQIKSNPLFCKKED
ncbi:hypothetical protein PPYR_08320 [Photinus pyralis]|uniref:Uncharacterized protein n=1 Tax=Photinus pyralis TaxID=7054 RepID=A0A5N4AJ60_PHOPY|nr:uncharacterized protein LOC116172352 [Photinus pyralis]KAB0797326.1 hypothetical protein PPYR_08320 [Photinus pyralis]